jgi:hypothetical protein
MVDLILSFVYEFVYPYCNYGDDGDGDDEDEDSDGSNKDTY